MLPAEPSGLALLLVATALVSALLVRASIAYAQRRALIDLPGRRRSHRVPTPRGGGIAIVATALLATALLPRTGLVAHDLQVPLAVLLVAAAGWIDDHRDLRASWRFILHCIAALLVVSAWLPGSASGALAWPLAAGLAALAVVGVAWSVNLHNFMDGIDGLLAWQAIFVLGVMAVLAVQAGQLPAARALALWAAATAGFLPFNFPRARIFMGDVGSGALGLVVAAGVMSQATLATTAAALIACSAFTVDASCTLLSRLVRGRRWYNAHREHLYQWLVRRGLSHARVVMLYMGWNLLVVTPVLVLILRFDALAGLPALLGAVVAVHGAGVALWWLGKRACLRAARVRRPSCCAS